jgi:F0F1-type ATP synthase membrane subunit b/b'
MDRPKDIYAPLAVQNWVEYADWLEAELERIKPAAQALVDAEQDRWAANSDVELYIANAAHELAHDALAKALEKGDG